MAFAADGFGQRLPAVPVVFRHAVFDGDDRIGVDQGFQVFDVAVGVQGLALAGQHVFAVLVVFAGGAIEGQHDVGARFVTGGLDRFHDEIKGLVGRLQARGEAALVAHIGVVTGIRETFFKGVEDFRSHAHGLGNVRRGHRHDHEFLDVDGIVGMFAAVDDVHHRHRQLMGMDAAHIGIQGQRGFFGGGLGRGQADAENGIGAEPRFILGAVQFDHGGVDFQLVFGVKSGKRLVNLAIDRVTSLEHALAVIAALIAVAQFDGLMDAGGSARRHGGAARRAGLQHDFDFDGGVAPGIQNLAAINIDDGGHVSLALLSFVWLGNCPPEIQPSPPLRKCE